MARDYVLEPFQRTAELQIDYARELNEQQLAAVQAPAGPSLVLAGAGSGKTRTLVYRVAWLLEHGVPADRILLLTFTNKAAREMMRRVTDLLGSDVGSLWGGTFHSIGHRVLRRHADAVGYRKDFTILDREDARDLLKTCIAEAKLDTEETRFPKPEVVEDMLSLAANTRQPVPALVRAHYDYFEHVADKLELLAAQYQGRKQAANVMDFDDLLVLWLKLLESDDAAREVYQRRFQHVLVDEYQDTNRIQAEVVDILGARHGNVMVVGDDCQSIYSWRGANFQNIIEFPRRYPKCRIFKIEQNYRSSPEILAVANAAIAPNVNQFQKVLAAIRQQGQKPLLVPCDDATQQAAFVAQRLLQLREEGTSLNNMAVLYRSHFHAMELQLELTRRHIPFTITSGLRFFEQAHVKDITAYLKFIANPRDEMSFKRFTQLLPGIGAKGAHKLWLEFGRHYKGAGAAASEPARDVPPSPLATALQACAPLAPTKSATAWAALVTVIAQLEAPELQASPGKLLQLALEAGYDHYLRDAYTNYRARVEDIEQLVHFATRFESVHDFLAQLALLTTAESDDEQPAPRDDERVRLSTIHQAKGLEFDAVFVIMLCEKMFPSARSLSKPDDVEEERRLFYVAITRARNELYLTYPLLRWMGGQDAVQQRSRFLSELPQELLEELNLITTPSY